VSALFINGERASVEDLKHQALVNYGAFTSFRVEGGGVRGFDLHLARLEAEAVELFGVAVPERSLRDQMRMALAGRREAWLRVSLFAPQISMRQPSWVGRPEVMVGVFDPPASLPGGMRLQAQTYAREVPQLKHAGTFGLVRARRQAVLAGFDDALFVDGEGRISEGSIWNIGFVRGETVIWPEAPMLAGTGQALLQRGMADLGLNSETRPVRLSDLAAFDAAFICNSATPACAVASIDGHRFGPGDAVMARLIEAWRSNPCQTI
jgi:branched-subunit amino acid aminotransferase/4-amino-4-deoxychorismate lyase